MALGSMNRTMNLPSLQRIAMEFERENDIMEQRQEMMDDAIDDAMDVGLEEEGDEVVEQVLEEIGVDLSQAVCTLNMTQPANSFQGCLLTRLGLSSAKLHQDCNRTLSQKPKLPRLSAAVVVAGPILAMMTSRHDWTVCGGDTPRYLRTLSTP